MILFSKDNEVDSKIKVRLIPHSEIWRRGGDTTFIASKGKDYVSDAIGNSYLDWEPNTPILISAQTGAGKNHFIEKVLIPQAEQCEKKILIISNRIALSLQIKIRIAKITKVKVYSNEWLLDNSEFDYVHIYTYHKFMAEKNTLKASEYQYIVLDEAHFFMSDAIFNHKTGFILDSIPKEFNGCTRIYMTATPDEVAQHLVDVEKKYYRGYIDRFNFVVYELERDYSYIQAKYFNDIEEIMREIVSDSSSEDKWLIFVTSKEKGRELQTKLVNAKVDAAYFDSESKYSTSAAKGDQLYNEILEKEMFFNKVLISTSVLDNGINFNDEKLKNIVIFAYDKTTFLQMLGRKRIIQNQEKVNLYIQNKTRDMINGKKHILDEKRKAIHMFENSKYDFFNEYYNSSVQSFEIIHGLFYFVKDNCCYNPLGRSKIEMDSYFLSNMMGEIVIDPYADVKKQLSWLGLENTFDEKNWLNYSGRQESQKKLNDFFAQNFERSLRDEIEQADFGRELKILYNNAYGSRKNERAERDSYGMKIIKDIMIELKLPYELVSKKEDGKSFWKFIPKDSDDTTV